MPRFSPIISPGSPVETQVFPQVEAPPERATRVAEQVAPQRQTLSPGELAAQNPTQSLAAFAGLVILFYHFSNITELITSITGLNLKLAYWTTAFAGVAVLASGGLVIPLRYPAIRLYLLAVGWMILALPFSSWVGGSVESIKSLMIVGVPTIFFTAGLILQWQHVRAVLLAIGLAGAVVVGNALFYGGQVESSRFSLSSSGMLGNSNDLAAHLVLMIPIFLLLTVDKSRAAWVRLMMIGLIPAALLVVLKTGSRGALVGLGVCMLVVLWKAPGKTKIALTAAALLFAVLAPLLLPDNIKRRLTAFSDDADHEEALVTKEIRRELFLDSVKFSLRYPIFGVGFNQFGTFRGVSATKEGHRTSWHATHCVWTQISSENGLPALALVGLALFLAIRSVNRLLKQARSGGFDDIVQVCFYLLLAVMGFLVSITFLAQAYRFYIPAIIGLMVAVAEAGRIEINRRESLRGELSKMQTVQPRG